MSEAPCIEINEPNSQMQKDIIKDILSLPNKVENGSWYDDPRTDYTKFAPLWRAAYADQLEKDTKDE